MFTNYKPKKIRENSLFINPLNDSERATMLSNLDLVSRNQFRLRFTTPPAVHLLRPLCRGRAQGKGVHYRTFAVIGDLVI